MVTGNRSTEAYTDAFKGKNLGDTCTKTFKISVRTTLDAGIQIVFDGAIEPSHSILPGDLFALCIGTTKVRNGNFIDVPSRLCYFGRHLGFKSKPIFLQVNGSQDLSLERLVASPYIRQIEIGQHVRDESEKFISDRVPEE